VVEWRAYDARGRGLEWSRDWSGVGTGMGLEKGLELTTGIDNGGVVELRPAGNVGVLKSYGIRGRSCSATSL
jgi:hypothetical protein